MPIAFDGPTKRINLSGVTTLSVRSLWTAFVDWWLTSDNSKYALALRQVGGDDIDPGAGTSVPIFIYLENGWKIKPQEADHTLSVTDGVLVDLSGSPFVHTTGNFQVLIKEVQPVQAIGFAMSGGGSGGTAVLEKLLRNRTVTDPTTGRITVYDDDDVSPLFTADLWEDAAGTKPYEGRGADRRDRLV